MTGTLALVGGEPFAPGCDFNRTLLDAAGASEVVVLPTAAAFEGPEQAVEEAVAYFSDLGITVKTVMVIKRADANEAAHADTLRKAKAIYLIGSSGMHARPTLQDTPVWEAIVQAWNGGATVIGSDAGAQILCDPMVDDRGGAFTVGLGLIDRVAVATRYETLSADALQRMRQMTNEDLAVIGVDTSSVAIRSPEGSWTSAGAGNVSAHIGSEPVSLDDLNR